MSGARWLAKERREEAQLLFLLDGLSEVALSDGAVLKLSGLSKKLVKVIVLGLELLVQPEVPFNLLFKLVAYGLDLCFQVPVLHLALRLGVLQPLLDNLEFAT